MRALALHVSARPDHGGDLVLDIGKDVVHKMSRALDRAGTQRSAAAGLLDDAEIVLDVGADLLLRVAELGQEVNS